MGRRLAATDRATDLRTRHPDPPATVTVVAGDVAGLALELADGDRRRLELLPDGAVVVHNRPRR